jgi:hypothetical protein
VAAHPTRRKGGEVVVSTWNYRVIAQEDPEFGEVVYGIHEVFYDDEGSIDGWTKAPVPFLADSKVGLLDALAKAGAAAAGSVLWWEGDELREVRS